MTSRRQELVSAWFAKASHDLAAARLLIASHQELLDVAVYHCQQAAEKALKAWLTGKDVIFPKTHSLEDLLALCTPVDPDFNEFQNHAEELTPFATAYRDPGDASEPVLSLAERALAQAEELFKFCKERAERTGLGGASEI